MSEHNVLNLRTQYGYNNYICHGDIPITETPESITLVCVTKYVGKKHTKDAALST